MVDVARTRFPDETTESLSSESGSIESAANQVLGRLKNYAKDEPIALTCWAFVIGFVLGWRLKPW